MDQTSRLTLPYLLPNQAQKHVTLNETLDQLDNLIGAYARSRQTSVEPGTPEAGDIYILPVGASGAQWTSFTGGDLVIFRDGSWQSLPKPAGLLVWIEDETQLIVREPDAWRVFTPGSSASSTQLGINTTSSVTNRLAVKSDAVLFSHDDVTPGSGDMRQSINRLGAGNIGSLLFQTDTTANAEIGLVAETDLSFRTSSDGTTYKTGLSLRATDGKAAFPEGFIDPQAMQDALALRHSFGVIADDAVATLDFNEQIFGGALLLLPNALSSGPAVFFYARLATNPSLISLFSAGHSFTTATGELTGMTGMDGGINFSATQDGRFIVENRRGYGVGYTAFVFR